MAGRVHEYEEGARLPSETASTELGVFSAFENFTRRRTSAAPFSYCHRTHRLTGNDCSADGQATPTPMIIIIIITCTRRPFTTPPHPHQGTASHNNAYQRPRPRPRPRSPPTTPHHRTPALFFR